MQPYSPTVVSQPSIANRKELWASGDDPAGYTAPILIRQNGQKQLIGWTPKHVLGYAIQWRDSMEDSYDVTGGLAIATPIFEQGHVLVCGYWEGSNSSNCRII